LGQAAQQKANQASNFETGTFQQKQDAVQTAQQALDAISDTTTPEYTAA
jgi:hypothetical protein